MYWLSLPKQVKSMLFGSLVRKPLVKEVYFGKPNMKVKQLGKRRLGKVSGWNDFQCGGEK